ncbi:MAG: hypothetical protein IT480_18510, partial [Gammaproteobacteria bacterium]|nr:hypothetical protein [Gammaproteobacteria bacterium]
LCEVCNPPLSSIHAGHSSVGYAAAATLDVMLRGRAPVMPRLTPPQEVVARLSTDMLAVEDPKVVAALRYLRDHAHQGLGVEGVARASGLSRSVLQRRFRLLLRRSVHDEHSECEAEAGSPTVGAY